jgi:hypothetical protein
MLKPRLSANFRQNLVDALKQDLRRTFLALCDAGSFTAYRPMMIAHCAHCVWTARTLIGCWHMNTIWSITPYQIAPSTGLFTVDEAVRG